MHKRRMAQENHAQAQALNIINPEREPDIDVLLCELYGAEWRQIICDYEESLGCVPSGHDLVWIVSQHIGADVRTAFREYE